ncbi:MAG: S9 family peptidase [Gemmatimonadaceae bacterium]|nr:S9 family peptidase [Gemmatimonadaceae bacterium]
MRLRPILHAAMVLGVSTALLAFTSDRRPITDRDIWLFTWIGDPQLAPDGSRVAFAKVVADQKHAGYETSLWMVPAKGESTMQRLTSGTRDSQPRWSLDGTRIAFVRSIEKDGKPQPPQIYVLSMSGGEPVRITDLPKGAGDPHWSPDGRRIAFTSNTSPEDIAAKNRKPGEDTTDASRETDVKYITRAVYRFNGAGYLDTSRPSHIWVASLPAAPDEAVVPKQLTTGKFDEDEFFWSKDGRDIVFSTTRVAEPYYELPHTDIYRVSADGGQPQLVNAVKIGVSQMSPSPDGKRIAFRSNANEPVRSYAQPDLYVLDLTPGAQPKNLSADFDFDVGDGVGGDNTPPRAGGGTQPYWSADGSSIVDVVAATGRANLMRFPVNGGKPLELTKGDQAVQRFSYSADGSVALLVSTPVNIGDLFVVGANGGDQKRLTDINRKLFSQLNLTPPEEIWYTSFDGQRIQAWVQKPPDFDKSKKYPLILNIHGGPHTAYGWVFDHEFQWMAAKGYVVLYPNPRGSTSYGQDFGNVIQYKYPGDDYKDLMAGVDELIKRGYIDETRLGVTGGSGGGVLTNWTVTQTNRFKAAVSQRDISNWASWWYSADFWLYYPQWFRKAPFEDPREYADRSAITYVDRIHTPMAFILGDADLRTPTQTGGEELFRALKYLKRPTAMVRFPGESHELSRGGQPWHRVERLQAIVGWFDKYLLGKDVAIYRDVAPAPSGAP